MTLTPDDIAAHLAELRSSYVATSAQSVVIIEHLLAMLAQQEDQLMLQANKLAEYGERTRQAEHAHDAALATLREMQA